MVMAMSNFDIYKDGPERDSVMVVFVTRLSIASK